MRYPSPTYVHNRYQNDECRGQSNVTNEEHNRQQNGYGRHTGWRTVAGVFRARLERGFLVGVSGRKDGETASARRMNCIARRGEPGEEAVFTERGLVPPGVETASIGIGCPLGSGVRGGWKGVSSWID